MNPSASFITSSTQLWLEVSASDRAQAWERSRSFSSVRQCWMAYLNQLALSAILPWLQADSPHAAIQPNSWEVVNGTAIALNNVRFVLIPSDAADLDELRVPQEWIDIPDWAADYYLAVQVKPDDGWINVWGGTTHHRLKTQGIFESRDRTYCLGEEELVKNLSALLVAREICPEEVIQASIAPLPTLSVAQADSLLQRLGSPTVALPRLQVPFELWGTLLQHESWRRQLCDRRQGIAEQWSVLHWFRTGVSAGAQQAGWQYIRFQPSLGTARGDESAVAEASLVRQLIIANQTYELRVTPQGDLDSQTWRFELRNANPQELVPSGFTLRLLTEDLQPFPRNEATATTAVEQLYLRVAVSPGDKLVWEVEPTPEGYDREILQF